MQKLCGIIGSWLALALPWAAHGQQALPPDSVNLAAAVTVANQAYITTIQPVSILFDGPEYVNHVLPDTKGDPFFLTAEPQVGTLAYRDGFFREVPLSYDLLLDQVVMYYPGKAATVLLVADKITFFTLGSHRFVRLAADSSTGVEWPTGFYELLLAGPVSLLAHHSKKVERTLVQQNLTLVIRQTDQLYAKTSRGGAEITSLKSLLAVLPPAHQAEVQRYARHQKLGFSPAQREASALSLLRYHATLPQ